LKTAGLLG